MYFDTIGGGGVVLSCLDLLYVHHPSRIADIKDLIQIERLQYLILNQKEGFKEVRRKETMRLELERRNKFQELCRFSFFSLLPGRSLRRRCFLKITPKKDHHRSSTSK